MIEEGKIVPKFQLQDADGNIVKSSQLKGEKICRLFLSKRFYTRLYNRSRRVF